MQKAARRDRRAPVLAALICAAFVLCAASPAWAAFKIVGQGEAPAPAAETTETDAPGDADPLPSTYVAPPDLSGLDAVRAADIADGAYQIEVTSSSSMFRIVDARLVVEGDSMSCALTLGGTGYGMLFMGTAEQAQAVPSAGDGDPGASSAFIYYEEDDEGRYVYTVPVDALNVETPCAAFSTRRQTWYDRTLVFLSTGLPSTAFASVGLSDGTYRVDVTLQGGSGKAHVASPAEVVVSGGEAAATIEWSSPYYDRMVVDGVEYLPVNEDGDSVFVIPAPFFDEPLPVRAETTAMSEPHMIDYTLAFDSSSAERVDSPVRAAGASVGGPAILGLAVVAATIYLVQRRGGACRPSPR